MKPRWILLSLLASITLAWLTHWYQTKPAWSVTLKAGSSLLGISEDGQTIFLDENTSPTIYPSALSKRSLATGQLLQQIPLEKNDAPWHDSADVRVSPDQRYLIMTEGYRRDSRGIAVLYDLSTGKPLKQWSLIEFQVQAIIFSRDSKYLIFGTDDNRKPTTGLVVRILNLETTVEQLVTIPLEGFERRMQVIPTDDMNYIAIKVVRRGPTREQSYLVRLINCQTNKVIGQWECCNEPLVQTGPNSFGFQVEAGEEQQQLVLIHTNEKGAKAQPVDGLVFAHIDEPKILYRYSEINFHRFCEYEPSRLAISSVKSSTTSHGLGLFKWDEPNFPIPWLRKHLVNWNILRTTHQFRWLDIATKTCSEPVSVGEHGMTEVLASGVVQLDNHQHLRYFTYPSRWRWYITVGMALLPFIALLLLRRRLASLVPSLRLGTHCELASGRLQS
jgi:WD40 repeat protein